MNQKQSNIKTVFNPYRICRVDNSGKGIMTT